MLPKIAVLTFVFSVFLVSYSQAGDSDNPFYVEGLKHLNQGEFKQAEEKLAEAAKSIRNPHLFLNLGNAYRGNRKWKEAFGAYERAIALNKRYAPAYAEIGRSHELLGDRKRAEWYYKKTLKIDKDYALGQAFMGWFLFERGEVKKAERYFDRILEKEPYFLDAVLGKGRVLWNRGEKMEAAYWFKRALALGFKHPAAEEIVARYDKGAETSKK